MFRKFIERPILSSVISIIIVILGSARIDKFAHLSNIPILHLQPLW